MIKKCGFLITMVGVMMADTEALWVPMVVVGLGLLLMKIGGAYVER